MNQFLAIMVAGFGMLWTIKGITDAVSKKRHWTTNLVQIGYPAFVFIVMLYFLGSGVIE